MNTAYKKGLDESCEGKTMKKKVLIFYGLNILVTVFLAILFGGILGSIGGNELMLGLFIVSGVQLSPLVTTVIVRKIYKQKRSIHTNSINT